MSLQELANKSGEKISIHYVSLDDLAETFLEGNSKKHDNQKIIESIRRYGFKDPIAFDPLLNDGRGGIVEGNGRLEALLEMRSSGMGLPRGVDKEWKVPILFGVNSTSMAEAVAYSIEHNWSVLWGSEIDISEAISIFDTTSLKEQLIFLGDLESLPISIESNIDSVLEAIDDEEYLQKRMDRFRNFTSEEEEIEEIVSLGDIWQLGDHFLCCGDSSDESTVKSFLGEVVPTFIWSDPPYGIGISKSGKIGRGGKKYETIAGDESEEVARKQYNLCQKLFPESIYFMWGGNHFSFLPSSPCWIVWDKRDGMVGNDFADAELCWSNQSTPVRLFAHLWNGAIKASESNERRIHPTQKPVALFNWVLEKYGDTQNIIFDPFCGSGISIIGAEEIGRSIVYGMEILPSYCSKILNRFKAKSGKEPVKIC